MAIYVLDPEAVLAFRRDHRRQVIKQRGIKRKQQAARPRDRKYYDELDRQWIAAIERDRS